MKSSWKLYTIMFADRRVASIRSDGSCVIYCKTFLPYNLFLEPAEESDLEGRLNNLQNFYYWCASRILTLDRKYAKEILNSIGAKQAVTDRERAQISLSYHCLSLTDVYWVKEYREKVSFAEINLFEHSLSEAFVPVSLKGTLLTVQNAELISKQDIAGDIGTAGVAPKAWVRRNGTFYLLKDGDRGEVEAELLASKIARCFDVEQVLYDPELYDGEEVSSSRIVTSLDRSIVAMEFVEVYAANHEMDKDELILKLDAYSYYMMNIVDYLVGNVDRHWGNWGVLVDNSTNKPISLYPLMDFNKSFGAYGSIDGAKCLTAKNMSQKEAALDAVRRIGLNQIAEIDSAWFKDKSTWDMFSQRLAVLKEAELRK